MANQRGGTSRFARAVTTAASLPANSAWMPNSAPGVKSQPWKYNYMDGECGIRNLDNNYDRLDPEIPDASRAYIRCSQAPG